MKNYSIVCTWTDEEWLVQEHISTYWTKEHRCAAKGEEGYKEAKQLIKENEK